MRDELKYSLVSNKSAKQQALEVINQLKSSASSLQVGRANMKLALQVSPKLLKTVLKDLADIIQEQTNVDFSIGDAEICIQPNNFNSIRDRLSNL